MVIADFSPVIAYTDGPRKVSPHAFSRCLSRPEHVPLFVPHHQRAAEWVSPLRLGSISLGEQYLWVKLFVGNFRYEQ